VERLFAPLLAVQRNSITQKEGEKKKKLKNILTFITREKQAIWKCLKDWWTAA